MVEVSDHELEQLTRIEDASWLLVVLARELLNRRRSAASPELVVALERQLGELSLELEALRQENGELRGRLRKAKQVYRELMSAR